MRRLGTYAYPGASNRLASIAQAGATVRSFTYDAAGNMTGDTRSGTAYAAAISDAGRMAQLKVGGVIKANYTYDARNRLSVRRTLNMTPAGTTHLIHDAWDHVIVETNGAGTAVREYVWFGDLPVAVLDGSASTTNPTLLWVHADHLKRPDLMTDSAKAVVWKALYEPFGAVSSITGNAANTMRLPGQWYQLETGLHYNWWRHYDPTLGRYTQPDPLGISQGPAVPSTAGTAPVPNGSFVWNAGLPGGATGQQAGPPARLPAFGENGRQGPVATGADFTASFNPAAMVTRDGSSLFAYVRQSPAMRSDPNGLETTKSFSRACKLLKLNPDDASETLHRLKKSFGLRGDDNCTFDIDSGDVYFGGKCIGNLYTD